MSGARHCTEQALRLKAATEAYGGITATCLGIRASGGVLQGFSPGVDMRSGLERAFARLAISLSKLGEHRQVVELLTPLADEAVVGPVKATTPWLIYFGVGECASLLGEKDRALQRWREGTHGAEGEATFHRPKYCPSTVRGQTVHRG